MSIFIRRMTSEDFEGIRALQTEIQTLHEKNRPDLFRPGAVSYTEKIFLDTVNDPNWRCAVAERDGTIVGFLFAWVRKIRNHRNLNDANVFLVDDICVAESDHRRGFGRALWDYAEAAAQEAGCARIELNVYSFNESARAFYEAMGLKTQVLRMEKELEAQHEN